MNGTVTSCRDANDTALPVIICGWLLSLFAFITNFLVFLVLTAREKLKKNTYTVLVLNLSIADIVVSSCGILQHILKILEQQSDCLCKAVLFFFSNGIFMSVYFTFVLSLNRFLSAASAPWKDKLFDGNRKYILLFLPCLIVSLVNMTFVFVTEEHITTCSLEQLLGANLRTFSIFMVVLNIPILFSTLLVYILAIYSIHKRFTRVMTHVNSQSNAQTNIPDVRKQRHVTAVWTVGAIIVFILIGTTPYLTVFLVFAMRIEVPSGARVAATAVFYITSALNPVFYTWRLKEFRTEIRAIVCCHFRSVNA